MSKKTIGKLVLAAMAIIGGGAMTFDIMYSDSSVHIGDMHSAGDINIGGRRDD